MYIKYTIQLLEYPIPLSVRPSQKFVCNGSRERAIIDPLVSKRPPGPKSCQLFRPNSASWSEGLIKTPCPVSCFFTDNLCMKCLFCKKNGPIWPSLAVEAPVTSSATYRGSPLPAMSTDKYKRHSRAICLAFARFRLSTETSSTTPTPPALASTLQP